MTSSVILLPSHIEDVLSTINLKGQQTRIRNELKLMLEMYNIVIISVKESGDMIVTVTEVEGEKKSNYKFVLGKNYPFHPPEIFFNNYPYKSILTLLGDYQRDKVKKFFGEIKCFCCRSITCSSNWSPAMRMFSMIGEVNRTLVFKRGIVNLLLAEKIQEKYNIPYANLESYLGLTW